MAYGLKAFRKAWLGKETTTAPGTEVAADIYWRGTVEGMKDDRAMDVIEEDIGMTLPSGRIISPRVGATWEVAETPATYQQLPYIFSASVEGTVTGAADSAGANKIYQFDRAACTAAGAVATYTIEVGDNVRVDKMTYGFVEEWTLSGAAGEAVMLTATWRGRETTDGEFTSTAPTLPAVEEILFTTGKLYVDATTIGTTQKTGSWLGFSVTYAGGNVPLYTGDGNATAYFSTLKPGVPEITGELTFEHDATGTAEITAARNKTLRYVRMLFAGSSTGTAGALYSHYTLKMDLAIKYTEVPVIDAEDTDDVVTLPFTAVYNTSPQFTVVNKAAAL